MKTYRITFKNAWGNLDAKDVDATSVGKAGAKFETKNPYATIQYIKIKGQPGKIKLGETLWQ